MLRLLCVPALRVEIKSIPFGGLRRVVLMVHVLGAYIVPVHRVTMKRIPFGGLKPCRVAADRRSKPGSVTMKRIPFGGLKRVKSVAALRTELASNLAAPT
jgi:hypothetical protein